MTLDETIKRADVCRETIRQQLKSIEQQSAVLQQRYQTLTIEHARADGALSALIDLQKEGEDISS